MDQEVKQTTPAEVQEKTLEQKEAEIIAEKKALEQKRNAEFVNEYSALCKKYNCKFEPELIIGVDGNKFNLQIKTLK